MRERLTQEQGVTIIELIVAMVMTAFLILWILQPIRNSQALANYANLEMMQRQQYKLLNPIIEDIREASSNTLPWDKLDPTKSNYDPKVFPWFLVQDPGVAVSQSYICYHFDDASQTLKRVQTPPLPTPLINPLTTPCDALASGGSETTIAGSLLTPTATEPLFRADPGNAAIYFTLRIPLGAAGAANQGGSLPQVLTVSRMGAVRN